MRRLHARLVTGTLCAALILTLTTACSLGQNMTPIEEYRDQAETIGTMLTETIEDVPRNPDGIQDLTGGHENGLDLDANGPPWEWIWRGSFSLDPSAHVSPEDAAHRMAQLLEDEGWSVGEATSVSENRDRYEISRSSKDGNGNWIVDITFDRDGAKANPTELSIDVVSPMTSGTNGTLDAEADFEDVATRLEAALDDLGNQARNARLRASLSGNMTTYLKAMDRWNTASNEVRTLIRHIRESLDPGTAAVGPETPGEPR